MYNFHLKKGKYFILIKKLKLVICLFKRKGKDWWSFIVLGDLWLGGMGFWGEMLGEGGGGVRMGGFW